LIFIYFFLFSRDPSTKVASTRAELFLRVYAHGKQHAFPRRRRPWENNICIMIYNVYKNRPHERRAREYIILYGAAVQVRRRAQQLVFTVYMHFIQAYIYIYIYTGYIVYMRIYILLTRKSFVYEYSV